MVISIDFETRSTVNLKKTGVYTYALHPDTDVWVMAYAVDDGPVRVWRPGDPVPSVFRNPEAVTEYRAWNAEFERVVYAAVLARRYGFPRVPLEKWFDTAAQAAAMALPRGLGNAAQVMGLPVQKDQDGRRLMLQMSKPRRIEKDGTIIWWDEPEKIDRLVDYCCTDVQVERALGKVLPPLSPKERWVYIMDQRANTRGFQVDHALVAAAQAVTDQVAEKAGERLAELTSYEVRAVTDVNGITSWLKHNGLPDLPNLQKDTVRDLLAGELPSQEVREVLQIRADTGKTSTAKLSAFLEAAGPDGRVRGTVLYHGASTGRWAGRLVQPQNFPRPEYKNVERFIPTVMAGGPFDEPPAVVVSSLLRSMIVAGPGKVLRSGDYSQIEARVIAWLAGQDDLVRLFEEGGKVYETMASVIFGKPVYEINKDSFERQIGKNSILGCGFGMGWERFQEQVKEQTGIDIPDELAKQVIEVYRGKNARIKSFWDEIYRAAFRATARPGSVERCGRNGCIRFAVHKDVLWCTLPSGRRLAYSLPRIEDRETPWGEVRPTLTFCTVNGPARRWERVSTYGGHLTENVVQAIARDCMAEAWLRLEVAGYPVIMTVHDELVAEPDAGHGSQEEYERLLATRPSWAPDLPVAVEGWEGRRYRK